MLGDITEVSTATEIYEFVIKEVQTDKYIITPRDHFGYDSTLIKISDIWQVAGFNVPHTVQISPMQLKLPKITFQRF